jgi:hypothetical protein
VTEPDPPTDLAAQLEELRGQWARTQGELGAVRERLTSETSQTAMLRLEVKHLREDLAEAVDKRRLKPPPAPWLLGDEAETRPLLAGLRAWVEQFLRPNYPEYAARLPECWAAHGAALWELATLRAEWDRIYADEENRDLAGALNWLHQLLPGVLNRLADAIKCGPGMCQLARRRQP